MGMARNTRRGQRNTRRGQRNTRGTGSQRPSRHGVLAVVVIAGGLVVAAANGYAVQAALAGYVLCLLSGRAVTRPVRLDHRRTLRLLGWVSVAGAAVFAAQGTTSAGGPVLGVALAVALAVALKLTATGPQRVNRNTRRG
jgi:hypothetical protein